MLRKIITIDSEKCNGCGLCADACHEGAIGMVDGKARLLREDYCAGLRRGSRESGSGGPKNGSGAASALRLSRHPVKADQPSRPGGKRRAGRAGGQPPFPLAGADQAGAGERPLV